MYVKYQTLDEKQYGVQMTPEQAAFLTQMENMATDPSIDFDTFSEALNGPYNPWPGLEQADNGVIMTPEFVGSVFCVIYTDLIYRKRGQAPQALPYEPADYPVTLETLMDETGVDELSIRHFIERAPQVKWVYDQTYLYSDNVREYLNSQIAQYEMTLKEAMEATGMSRGTIQTLLSRDKIRRIFRGSKSYLHTEDLNNHKPGNAGTRSDVLSVRCGKTSTEDHKLLFVADVPLEITDKFTGGIEAHTSSHWKEAVVLTESLQGPGRRTRRCFQLKYSRAHAGNTFEHKGFFVRGSFDIIEYTNNTGDAMDMYDAESKRLKDLQKGS